MVQSERSDCDADACVDEKTALLQKTEDEHRVLQLSPFVNANSGWYIFLSNAFLCIFNLIAISGAFFFVMASYESIMPKCYAHKEASAVSTFFCNYTTFCFWTYPLICPMVMIIVIFKNLLQTRLYYEFLLSEMLVDFESDALSNPGVWVLLIWGISAFGMLFFLDSTLPTDQLVFSLLAYWAPIVTFLIFLFSRWSIETSLIPVPSLLSTDPEHAGRILHHASRCILPESHMQVAFQNTIERLDKEKATPRDKLNFFRELKEACIKELEECGGPGKPVYSGMSCLGSFGLVERPQYKSRFDKVSRPEVVSNGFALRHGYWIYNLLFSSYLVDARSASFRSWARSFLAFIFLSAMIFAWMMARTSATYMVFEHLLSADHTWARRLCFKEGEHTI